MRYSGRRMPQDDTVPLLRGADRYVADIRPPGCLDVAFTRSYLAHGELRGADVRPARAAPGVVHAAAATDLDGLLPDVPRPPRGGQPAEMRRPALARDRVRFVGEAIAVVAATDRYAAADAAELVEVDLHPLPCVLDPIAALRPGAPALFDGCGNLADTHTYGAPVDDVLAAAPVVVESRLDNQRVSAMSIEPRGIVVEPGAGGYRVWCSHQSPHRLARDLATAFGLDQAAVRVSVPRVGGAFGAKSQTHPEYLVVFALARLLDRPIRWIEDRAEALTAATHGRDQHARVRIAADQTGRILALDAEIDADVGAYPHTGGFIPDMTCWVLAGPYATPRLHVRARSVVTNKAPTASYRGAGRPEAAYFLERTIDMLADRLGLDPAEVRRRNFVPDDAFPYTSPTGAVYDSGRYASALDLALELADYQGWRAQQRRRRAAGASTRPAFGPGSGRPPRPAAPLLGIGIASWIERSGGARGLGEFAEIEVTATGEVIARVGTNSQGQGHEVTFAQIAAEALDVPPERVRVVLGDTAAVRQGAGAFGSRSVQVGGSALYRAGQALLAEAHRRAAAALGGAVTYADGVFRRAGGAELPLDRLVARTGRLVAEDVFTPPQAFPFGSYVAVVEVDRRTGQVTIHKVAAVDDCGVVVNPDAVEGQIIGSIAQGIGQAMYERVAYDENGQPRTATLLDYFVPTAAEMPDIVRGDHVTPNPNVPLGAKGAGESGCIGAPPAIANAVWDALAGYDRAALQLPLTPDRVWRCLQRPSPSAKPGS